MHLWIHPAPGGQTHAVGIFRDITDVVMPNMNNLEPSARLRELKPELKCLYMSGYTDSIIDRDGVLGTDLDFIQKPFSREEIARRMRYLAD
ncbi:MAG: hypothetical protein ACYC6B_00005 [Thermoleophilia bacterium]